MFISVKTAIYSDVPLCVVFLAKDTDKHHLVGTQQMSFRGCTCGN